MMYSDDAYNKMDRLDVGECWNFPEISKPC